MSESHEPVADRSSPEAAGSLVPDELIRLHRNGLMSVLIVGGASEHRVTVARAFHRASELQRGPIVEVSARTQGDLFHSGLCEWLGLGESRPGANALWACSRGTLFLDEVTCLAPESQRMLCELLRRRPIARGTEAESWCGRLIVGSPVDPRVAVAAGDFSAPLLDCLDKVRVAIGRLPARNAA